MYFIALLGLSILTGYSGQISLGHGAFMAIGGYTTAILSVDGVYGHQIRDLWTIPIAGVVAGRRRAARRHAGAPPLRSLPRADHLRHRGVVPAVAEEVRPFLRRDDRQDPQPRQAAFRALDRRRTTGCTTSPGASRSSCSLRRGCSSAVRPAARSRRFATARWRRPPRVSASRTYKTLAFGISAFYAGVAGSLYAIAQRVCQPRRLPDHPLHLPRRRARGRRPRLAHRADRRAPGSSTSCRTTPTRGRLDQPSAGAQPRPEAAGHPEHRLRRRADRRHAPAPDGRRRLVASRLRAANKSASTLGPRWEWARGSLSCARSSARSP